MATNETTIKTDLPLLILRLVLGITMVMHGVQKAQMGFAGTQAAFESMGVPGAAVAGPATMIIELVGGALIILGAGTRIVGAIYTLVMLGAAAIVHLPAGFFVGDGGYEFVLVLAGISAALALTGAGAWSVDRLIGSRRSTTASPERVDA